jgi:hypothetical protein
LIPCKVEQYQRSYACEGTIEVEVVDSFVKGIDVAARFFILWVRNDDGGDNGDNSEGYCEGEECP